MRGSFAQDAQLSQFYAAPLYLAPSFAGSSAGSRVVYNYRNQWPSIPGAFVTHVFSYDHYFANLKSGLGVLLLRDQAGSAGLNTTNVGLQYSYNIKINKSWHVRPGLHFMYGQRGVDFSKLEFPDQVHIGENDPGSYFVSNLESIGYTDFSASVLGYSKKYWVGGVIDHLAEPNQSLVGGSSSILPRRYSLFGGAKFPVSGKVGRYNEESLSVAFLYKSQEKYDQLDLGAYWYKPPIVLGFWYRGIPGFKSYKNNEVINNDAVVLLVGYRLEDLRIGYSYDFTISPLLTNTGGAHEISLTYEFFQDQKVRKRRRRVVVPCPKF